MNINDLGAMAVSSQVLTVRSLLRLPFYKILLEMIREICASYLLMNINDLGAMTMSSQV